MRRVAGLLVLFGLSAYGCPPAPGRPPHIVRATDVVHTTAAEVPASAPPDIGPPTEAEVLATGPPPVCRRGADGAVACRPEELQVLIESARGPLQECLPSSTGKLTFRIRETPEGLTLKPDVAPSLNPYQRQCVLDTVNQAIGYDNPTLSTGGAGIPPSGFTSHIRIEW